MNKNKADIELRHMISVGLSQQAGAIDASMQAKLRRARTKAVSNRDVSSSWLMRMWQLFSVPSVMSAPFAQLSVALLVMIFSLSLVLMPSSPVSENGLGMEGQNVVPTTGAMDVLMSNEDMEFLENLEIYEWLVAEYG